MNAKRLSRAGFLLLVTLAGVGQSFAQASPSAAGFVGRERCDVVDRARGIDDLNFEIPRQQLQPASTFAENARVVCRIASKVEGSGVVQTQMEQGRRGGFGYQMMYSIAYGSLVKEGTEGEVSPDRIWEINCDINAMDDARTCEMKRGPLVVNYAGADTWAVSLGDSLAAGSDTGIRFGADPAIKAKGSTFSAEDSKRILEALPLVSRIRVRYTLWPGEVRQEEFQAEGIAVAVELMKWTYDSLKP